MTLIPNHIEREMLIEAPRDVVWSVVTEPAQISRWFSDAAEIDLRPGGRGAFYWKEHGTVDLRVERVERPYLFSLRWVYPEGSEPREGNSMLVEFTLSEERGNTRLRVVESGCERSTGSRRRRPSTSTATPWAGTAISATWASTWHSSARHQLGDETPSRR